MMRLQWTQDLDIETLDARGHWVTMEELIEVVTYHLPRYENTVKTCKTIPGQVNPSDLTFATKFVAVYLFIKVKGSRPMTYQYLKVDMVRAAKENGGFIDQKKFKTASKYGFESLILTDASMQVLDSYINFVRPLLKPQCEFVMVTRNGGQHSNLGDVMSKLVFDAVGKFIHECLQKLQGTKGSEVDREVQTGFSSLTSSLAAPVETAQTKSAPPKEKDSPPTNQLRVQRNYRRVLKFTADEDDFLKKGIDRHGFGQWTAILRDPDLNFEDGRTADSLKKRAGMKMQL